MLPVFFKIVKYAGYTSVFIFLFVLLYMLLAFILSVIPVNKQEGSVKGGISIYILSNGVHTDLVFPIKTTYIDWSQEIKFDHTKSKDTQMHYLAFGWGDKGFYLETPTWSDLKYSVAFKAMFFMGSSAMHTTFYKEMKENKNCIRIDLSGEAYQKLMVYIRESFQRDTTGNPILISGYHYGTDDSFYEAKGVYSLLYTCNTWSNNGLKAAGLQACLWTPFDKGIFYQYRKN